MKQTIWFPAMLMILLLSACGQGSVLDAAAYEHPVYTSAIEKEECCLCGDHADHILSAYWGQDNVGLLALNTFDLFPIDINLYGDDGQQLREAQGILKHQTTQLGELWVSAWTDPDRGDSRVSIPAGGTVDAEAIGAFLCQDCLDDFGAQFFMRDTPSEIAIVNFATRELRPLLESHPWFTFDHYAVDCDFGEDGSMELLIYYSPPRFQDE